MRDFDDIERREISEPDVWRCSAAISLPSAPIRRRHIGGAFSVGGNRDHRPHREWKRDRRAASVCVRTIERERAAPRETILTIRREQNVAPVRRPADDILSAWVPCDALWRATRRRNDEDVGGAAGHSAVRDRLAVGREERSGAHCTAAGELRRRASGARHRPDFVGEQKRDAIRAHRRVADKSGRIRRRLSKHRVSRDQQRSAGPEPAPPSQPEGAKRPPVILMRAQGAEDRSRATAVKALDGQ